MCAQSSVVSQYNAMTTMTGGKLLAFQDADVFICNKLQGGAPTLRGGAPTSIFGICVKKETSEKQSPGSSS